VIFTHGEEQARIAAEERDKVAASGKWKQPVVTQIEPAPAFWKAEEHHQRYFEKHGGSCHVSYADLVAEDAR
jgi:peptide-methionine (S)-S-oxide reductase